MVIPFEILIVAFHVYLLFPKYTGIDGKRSKRIINGLPLYSHDYYSTHFVVELVHTPFCASAQFDHRLEDCEGDHMCGGALIRPDFVLTACHCMVYEDYYAWDTWDKLPPVPDPMDEGLPAWLDEKFNTNSAVLYTVAKVTPKHPLLTLMTIWAGHASRNLAPQKRHASAFYPHHLCGARQSRRYPKLFKYGYEMDIGLVKSCEPFTINADVKLAPLPKLASTASFIDKIQRESHICLFTGWGVALLEGTHMFPQSEQRQEFPEILQHTFRFMQCHSECSKHYCYLCTSHHGPKLSHPKSGDSGTPVLCDGFVVGVHSASRENYELNVTDSVEVSVACVRELITKEHTDYLRGLNDEIFHWQNGKQVMPTSKLRSFHGLGDSENSSARYPTSLAFKLPPVLYYVLYWNR